MAQPPPPHNLNAPLPLRGLASAHEPRLWNRTCVLKAYKLSAARSITLGVVGFPNVGKSSLINTLKRAKVRYRVYCELEVIVVPL